MTQETGARVRDEGNPEVGRAVQCTAALCANSLFFSDREQVRTSSRNLKGTDYYITEQFPPEVAAKRRRLFKRVKEEKQAGRKAWVSYDTLYVNGKPVRDT